MGSFSVVWPQDALLCVSLALSAVLALLFCGPAVRSGAVELRQVLASVLASALLPRAFRRLCHSLPGVATALGHCQAAMALLHRYNMDSRDGAADERMELVGSEEGVYNCSAVGYCSEVCPKHVDPASAVNINKANAAKDYFLRFLSPKGGSK